MVDGVTKLTKIQFSNIEELQAENLRKMLLAMSRDVRVMIIKLCDRLHNMRTGDARPEQKRRDKARETMEVYAPIANRLGIPEREGRAGGPQPALPRSRGLRGHQQDAERAGRGGVLGQGVRRHRAPPDRERHRGCHHQAPGQEHLRHLPQDHHAEQVL